jgi:hypothetical protein
LTVIEKLLGVLIIAALGMLIYANHQIIKNGKFENGHRYIHVSGNRGWIHDPDCHCQLSHK